MTDWCTGRTLKELRAEATRIRLAGRSAYRTKAALCKALNDAGESESTVRRTKEHGRGGGRGRGRATDEGLALEPGALRATQEQLESWPEYRPLERLALEEGLRPDLEFEREYGYLTWHWPPHGFRHIWVYTDAYHPRGETLLDLWNNSEWGQPVMVAGSYEIPVRPAAELRRGRPEWFTEGDAASAALSEAVRRAAKVSPSSEDVMVRPVPLPPRPPDNGGRRGERWAALLADGFVPSGLK